MLITYSLPLRFTILQSTLRFLIEALTFIKVFFAFALANASGLLVPNNFYPYLIAPDYLYRKMILPLLKSYGLISTPTLSPGRIRM